MSETDKKSLAILMAITLTLAVSQDNLATAKSGEEKRAAGQALVDSFETMLESMGYAVVSQ